MTGGRTAGRLLAALALVAGLGLAGKGLVIPAKAAVAQVLLERAFEHGQALHRAVRPWPWADTTPIARITAPRLGVSRIVLSGGSGQAMAFGPTLLPGGAAPGERGTAVFAAHRDTHFRFLGDLKPGDVIQVETLDGRRTSYRMTGAAVVRRDRFAIDRFSPTRSIALTTCWPLDSQTRGPLRYVVSATRTG